MRLALDTALAVLPLVIVGGIGLFIILRLKYRSNKGTLGKKKSKNAQNLLDSLIPFGMMIGFAVSATLSTFTPLSLLSTTTWGSGIGMLFGYFAYEFYGKKEEGHSGCSG